MGFEGSAAVEGQLGLIERNTVECRGVGLQFVPTKGISEALRGDGLIGGTGRRLWMVGTIGYRTNGVRMWVMAEANSIVDEVDTRPAVDLFPLWVWFWL